MAFGPKIVQEIGHGNPRVHTLLFWTSKDHIQLYLRDKFWSYNTFEALW